ncbi:MAG: Ig-like domain-containing protein, partial [bacterium]
MKKILQRVTLSFLLALGLTGGLSASAENLEPVVSLTAPTNGAVFAQGQTIELSVDATDDGAVTNVDLYADGLLIGNTTNAPYGMSWSGASLGSHSLTAVAQDDAGQATTSTAVTVSVKTLANLSGYMSGDFHQHTTYTDGSNPFATVMAKDNEFGLDWWANSEHGGKFNRNAAGPILSSGYDTGEYAQYLDTLGTTFLGDSAGVSGGHTNMWRWQLLRDFSFSDLLVARSLYPSKTIVQGVEWNVPGHEHCSVGIITDEFGPLATNANAVAQFEYLWDANDADLSLGAKNT